MTEWRHVFLWLCITAFVSVVVALCASAVRCYRERKTHFHGSLATELAWTLAPVLIVLAVSFPAVSAALLSR